MKIMISDCDHVDTDIERDILSKAGLDHELKQCKTEDDLIRECKGANLIINQYAPFTEKVLKALSPELKQIVRYGVGVNNINLDAATEYNVQVCNVPDYGMNEVAEHALALTMELVRKTGKMNKNVHEGSWNYEEAIPLHRLSNLTLGVAGLGRNGRAFAHKSKNIFGKIIGFDPYYKPNAKDGTEYIEAVDFDTLLKDSDILVLHMPLTPETKNIINADALKKMKPGVYVVNVSRGGLINEEDLAKAVDAGTIAGAALDVTEQEPIAKDSPLLLNEKIVITPHMAWYSEEAAKELKAKTAEEIVRFAKGEKLRNPVNKLHN